MDERNAEADAWMETAKQQLSNTNYYRGLVVNIGEMLGPSAYISDDGSVQEDVLCAKVPELVAELRTRAVEAEASRDKLRTALKPFADYAENLKDTPDDFHVGYYLRPGILVSDCKRACAALTPTAKEPASD